MGTLDGRTALVTGGGRGIGAAIARALAAEGADVAINYAKRSAHAEEVAAAIRADGRRAEIFQADVSDYAACEAMAEQALERLGPISILVNNAATNPHFGTALEAADSYWQKTIEVNLMGNVWLSQAAVKVMRANGGGKIINVASIVGITPGRYQGIYSVTKAAIISFTKTLAAELGGDNIQVNAIAPGLVQTKFAQALWGDPDLLDHVLARTPAGRIGQPEDMTGIALFLASPASDFMTGAVIALDGGISAQSI